MSEPGDDELDASENRAGFASDSSPLWSAGASSVFNVHGAGTAAAPAPEPTTAAAPSQPPEEEEEPMATKRHGAARARKSSRGSPQLQICSALMQNDLARDAIAEALPDLTSAQISSALNNAKHLKRVTFKDAERVYALTAAGRKWVAAAGAGNEAPADDEPRARKSVAHRRGRRARDQVREATTVDTSPPVATTKSFRCAVVNDGCFWLTKNGVEIELDADEHREMLAYLERMAEEA